MSSEEIIRLLISFLGGGLVAGILNWLRASRAEKRSRRIEFLSNQLQKVYGPLYFYTSQNEKFFEHSRKILGAYDVEYASKEWSDDKLTRDTLDEETKTTIDLSNDYIGFVKKNNLKVIEILNENYSFADSDDFEVFQEFMVNHVRLHTETKEHGGGGVPHRIYQHLGSISFMRPAFMERVKTKFFRKREELDEHRNRGIKLLTRQ